MPVCLRRRLALLLFSAALGAASMSSAQTERVSCAEVLRELDAVVSRPGPATADPVKVAKNLGVDPLWVERCADLYGRRLSREPRRSGLSREEQEEAWESSEPEEFAADEFDARGEKYYHVIPDDKQNRERLRRFKSDSSNEWDPVLADPWKPFTGKIWNPYMLDQ